MIATAVTVFNVLDAEPRFAVSEPRLMVHKPCRGMTLVDRMSILPHDA